MDKLIILCMLGDPSLPAVSVKHTGGFQVDIQELLYNTRNSECSVHVITNTSKYCTKLYEEKEGYFIHRIRFEDDWLEDQNLVMKNFQHIKSSFFEILESILDKNVLIHSFYWLSGILALEAKQHFQINYVHTVVSLSIGKVLSGSAPYFSEQKKYEMDFLKGASLVFSITQAEREQLQQYYEIDSKQIIVVGREVHPAFLHPSHHFDGYPDSITLDTSEIQPVELLKCPWWSQGAYTYIGRIQTIKGLPYILMAWSQLYQKYNDITPPLWICGGTPNEIKNFRIVLQSYMDINLLNEYEKCQKIVWWGYLDPTGISTLLLKTRVLVTHSQYEPGVRVLLEALASSVPVIATPYGFAKDLIKNKINGLLVEYGNKNELISAMEYFMFATNDLLKMKKNAHDTYIYQHKKWNCYKKQFQVYYDLGLNCFEKYSNDVS